MSCYLMWTNIKTNMNKFYVAQGLKNGKEDYFLWTRYGRVGFDGVGSKSECMFLNELIK